MAQAAVSKRKPRTQASFAGRKGNVKRGASRSFPVKYWAIGGGAFVFLSFCLLSVWPQQKMMLLLKQLHVKQQTLSALQQNNTELNVQLEYMNSYRNVEEYAKKHLGMRLPRTNEVIIARKRGYVKRVNAK